MGKFPTLTGVPFPGFRRAPPRHGRALPPASKKPRGALEHSLEGLHLPPPPGGGAKAVRAELASRVEEEHLSKAGRVELVERLARLEAKCA